MTASKGFVVPAGGGKHVDDNEPGRFSHLKLLTDQTNGSIMMFEQAVPAGTKSWFHLHHNSDEVAWVLEGEEQRRARHLRLHATQRAACLEELRQHAGPRAVPLHACHRRPLRREDDGRTEEPGGTGQAAQGVRLGAARPESALGGAAGVCSAPRSTESGAPGRS